MCCVMRVFMCKVCEALSGMNDPDEAQLLRGNVLEEISGKELQLATDAASATLMEQVSSRWHHRSSLQVLYELYVLFCLSCIRSRSSSQSDAASSTLMEQVSSRGGRASVCRLKSSLQVPDELYVSGFVLQ